MAGKDSTLSDFILSTYKDITNVYAAGAGLPQPFPADREPRCEGYEFMGGTGENDLPCRALTVKCPVCNKESGLCAECLFQCDKCGKSMCTICMEAVGAPCGGCEQSANELFPEGCKCGNNGGGDCDWCSVYYGTTPAVEMEGAA